jgi:hypothetical protein
MQRGATLRRRKEKRIGRRQKDAADRSADDARRADLQREFDSGNIHPDVTPPADQNCTTTTTSA